MDNSNKVEIDLNVSVRVAAGKYGKYLQIMKNDRWINLSSKAWNLIVKNIPLIQQSLKDGSDYGITFTGTKEIRLGFYRDQQFVRFRETWMRDGKKCEKFINLNEGEFSNLVRKEPTISKLLQYDVIYSQVIADDWHLVKKHTGNDEDAAGPGDVFKYQLIPRMCDTDICRHLYAHLIAKEIKKIRARVCLGCVYGTPSQQAHEDGCLQFWGDAINNHFHAAKKVVCLEKALEQLNAEMQWSVSLIETLKNADIRQMVSDLKFYVAQSCTGECDKLVEHAEVYIKLFIDLKL